MKYSKNELESTMRIYKVALTKRKELIYKQHLDDYQTVELAYYTHIVDSVNRWISYLDEVEKEVLNLHYFQNMSVDHISIILNYANHSSVTRICKKAILKILNQEDLLIEKTNIREEKNT